MAALDNIESSDALDIGIPDWVKPMLQSAIAKFFWQWYNLHKEDKIVSIGWWFIKKTVRVKDIHGVFVLLFGPEPIVTTEN